MIFNLEKLKEARDAGIPDDEIWSHVSERDERFVKAKEAGVPLDEIATFFSEQQTQQEPVTPAEPAPPVGTSFFEEVAAIPQALRQAVDQPTEAMAETATVLGMPALGETLRGAVEGAEGYVPAAQRFMEPQEGEFQIGGFAPQFLPRAIVEQAGQIAGAIATRAAGAAIGGLAGSVVGPKGTVAGAVAGSFLGPALFEMSQIVGPVARERAANQGREEPTTDDLAWAWSTAGASGALNAIGAKYLPNGDKLVGGLASRIATAVAGEGTTEGLQSVVQQTGQTFLTEQGLEIKPKEAIGEALIGGGAGGAAVVAAAPFTPTPEVKATIAADTKVAAEQAAPVAPETAQVVSEQANQVITQAQAEEITETPDERVARLQREAQEAAGEIELEEEAPVAGLPPVEPTPPVTPTPEATVAPVEPVVLEVVVEPPEGVGITPPPPRQEFTDLINEGETSDDAYQRYQSQIDEIEDRLEAEGVDIVKLVDPTLAGAQNLIGQEGYTEMPPDLVEAYARREAVGAGQLAQSVGELTEALKNQNISEQDIKRVLDTYAIDVGKVDAFAQYKANEYTKAKVEAPPITQLERVAIALAAERGEMFDAVEDISKETLLDAGRAVKAIQDYFGVRPTEQQRTEFSRVSGVEFAALPPTPEAAPAAVEPTPVAPPPATPEVAVRPKVTPEERRAKLDRLKEIRDEVMAMPMQQVAGYAEGLSGLTTEEAQKYSALMMEAEGIRFDIRKELDVAKIPTEKERDSAVPAPIVKIASDELVADRGVFNAIAEAAAGTFFGQDTAVDKVMNGENPNVSPNQFYNTFNKTREALREKFGDTIKLYRAVGKQKEKATQNWHSTEKGALQYGRNVVSKDVPIDDIVALNVGSTGRYEEFIVGKKPEAEVALTVTPQLEPLRRVARAEQTEEDVSGLVDAGFVEVYNGQPVLTQAGLEALPEAERPRLTPEARKIQIDTRTSEAAAEAISKNLRIGVDQVPVDVRMPAGWTLEGDIYVPPQPQAAPAPARLEPKIEEDLRSQVVSGFEARSKRHKEFSEGLNKAVAANSLTEDGAILLREVFKDADPKLLGRATISINSRRRYLGAALRRGGTQLTENAIEKALDGRFGGNMTPEVMAMVVTHEIGHHGYNSILTKKERALIGSIFTKMGEKGRMEFFSRGAIEKPFQVKYHAKNQHEFFAQSFAEYVFSDRLPDPEIKPIFDRIIQKLKQAFQTLMNRNANIEQLVPLYEKLLGVAPTPEVREARREPAITPQQDRDYLAAVERGDSGNDNLGVLLRASKAEDRPSVYQQWAERNPMAAESLQRVVDAAARVAGYLPNKLYHGSAFEFNQFLKEKLGSITMVPSADEGFFFTTRRRTSEWFMDLAQERSWFQRHDAKDKELAVKRAEQNIQWNQSQLEKERARERPSEDLIKLYENGVEAEKANLAQAQRAFDVAPKVRPTIYEAYLSLKNPLVYDYKGKVKREKSYKELLAKAKEEGRDGVILRNTYDSGERDKIDVFFKGRLKEPEDIYVVFEPNQIKRADPVTYDDQGNIIPPSQRFQPEQADIRYRRRVQMGRAGMETSAVEARLQELGFPTGGIIRVVNEPDADFEGRTIILDGKVTGIELNAAAMRDNATIDRVLNHEFAESANADGALNRLVERLTPKEKKEINDTITRLRYEERARTSEEAARAIETLAEAWKGRGFFTRAVARVEAWASKLGFKLTRRAAEYIAARNLADINAGFRTAYNQFINVRGEVREGRAEDQAVIDADMGRRSQTELTPQEIDQLEKGEKIRVYRAMQVIDGKLYPPMSALVGGKLRKPTEIGAWEKAEERPDLLDKKGKFVLQKGNKATVPAAYNPYFHTSSSPLNDQFSSAYKRDNLVTVEVEIPASELTSGYKAEGAKDAVGEVRWNAGPVSSKLPADKKRRVFLSRYAKVVRIVPDSEVAEVISGLLEGTNLSIPENTVTPSLRSELEKRGVAVTPRPARGQEIRESRREPEAIPTFTEGTPEAATLKEMEASMAKVDAASEAKGGKPETYKISEIASVWMDSGLGERELQDAIVEYTNLTPANAARVAKAIAKQYGLQQQIAETGAVIAEIAPEPEGAPRKSAVTKLIEQTTGVRKPVVKLQVSESAALKKQIQLKAREARETRKARKEAAEDLAKAITDYVKANPIRGPINSRQAMSITKKALKLDVNNEAAVDRFEMYVERVIENANYDRDLADARALIKRAKTFAKSKDTQGNVKTTLDAIANVSPTLLDNPFEFNLVVQRYLLGLAPVTAKQYAVMPDADVRRYLESLETQIKDNQEVLDRSKAQRILDKQAAYANEKGIPLDEAIAILNSEEFLQEKTIEKLEDLTKLLNSMAQESQKDVKVYDDAGATPKQKELISFMRKVNLDSLTNEEKKRYIRFSNNLLANGATFGMEQFQSIALGQEAAMKAVKDRRLSQKLAAWISPIGGDKAIDTARKIALNTQSEADTFKNIFGRDAVGAFRNILGLNRLDLAQTASNNAKEQIANETGEYYKGLKKEYGEDATNFEAKGYAGVAGYLIQAEGNKTEAESIAYRRRLMEQSVTELRKSDMQSDQQEADFKERALAQLTGTSNADILSQLRAINPASYEQLMWWKDTMLPKWRDFLKEHDENFRNQANNYNNPDHLTITYKFPEGQLLPNEIEDVYQQDMVGMRIKQAANSIKRKEHANLPVSKTGTVANIDINFGYNQYNALVDQVDKAFVAPAWEQVVAFTNDKNFEQIMGGRANALFVKKLLTDIQTSRTRQSMSDDDAQVVAGGVRLARKMSTQAVLGGFTQPLRQVPDQLSKLFFTTGRFDLITKNLLKIAEASPLMNKFPIGRRGDAQAGTQYASQFSELARKVEASVTDRKWAKYRELMNKVGEFWMTPLRGSDVWAAKVSWMTYYEAYLNKQDIKMQSWEREAELVDTDQIRKDAASHAEVMVDFYGGASDPTKMASLSKQTNNGWKEFAKLLFLPLNSFANQQKSSLISDMRDIFLRTGDRKASIAAVAGTLAGMAAFHATRIYIIGGLVYPAGKAFLMGIFGIDMDEPDEEEKQKQLEDNWRKFKGSMYGNIVAGGLGQFVENNMIDAFNRTAYLWDANINPDSLLNDKGEIMSFRQYEKDVSPLYRFRSYGSSEYTFGLADVLTEQATHALAETQQLLTQEEMERYTGNEQAYAAFATGVEWMYFFRLMDTDLKRIATSLKRDMDKQVEEREAEIRAIRSGR